MLSAPTAHGCLDAGVPRPSANLNRHYCFPAAGTILAPCFYTEMCPSQEIQSVLFLPIQSVPKSALYQDDLAIQNNAAKAAGERQSRSATSHALQENWPSLGS